MLNPAIKSFIQRYGGLILCLALIGYWIFQGQRIGGNDFANSYFGATFFAQGKFDVGIFDPYTFNKRIYDLGYTNLFLSFNPNPPSTAIFFIPFTFLSLDTAKLLFNILTSSLFLLSTYRLCRQLEINWSFIMVCLAIVFFIPMRNQILFGQTYFLIFVLLVEGFIAHERKKSVLASFLWGAAILIKIFPAIIFLFLIIKKDWRQTLYLSITCGTMLFVSLLFQGVDVWKEYLFVVLPRNNQGEIQATYISAYQSGLMLFKYLFIKEEYLNPDPFIDSAALFKICLMLFKTAVVGCCTVMLLHRKDILSFGVTLLCGMLISPYGSTYSNILLLILLVGIQKTMNKNLFWIAGTIIFLIANLPVELFDRLPILLRFPRLILMCALLVLLIWKDSVKVEPKVFLAYLFLMGLSLIFQRQPKEDISRRILPKETHNLIYNYGIKDGFIFYNYWMGHPEAYLTNIAANTLSTDQVFIKQNQIFYKEIQLTHGADNKTMPMLFDGKAIMYLSDKGKGIGFYTLRIIPLNSEN
jgi:hypothetical protein